MTFLFQHPYFIMAVLLSALVLSAMTPLLSKAEAYAISVTEHVTVQRFLFLLALIGFAFFPLMPPRLLPTSYGFVDTLHVFGGPWSFDSGPVAKASNQYAAMPSLHFGWASWCTATFWPWATTRCRRVLLVLYPFVTLFAIVVTANHYSLDALGGFVTFLIGSWLGLQLVRLDPVGRSRRRKPTVAKR